ETAASLGRDVERYLMDEMVEARPPSLAYRLRKSLSKHRGPVIAVALVLLSLVGGVLATTSATLRALDAEREAHTELARALEQKQRTVENERQAKQSEQQAQREKLVADTSRHAMQMNAIFRAWDRDDMLAAYKLLREVPRAFQMTWEFRYL